MSKSTIRKCRFCPDRAYGPAQNGRKRLGGTFLAGQTITVGGKEVNGGQLFAVCVIHREMIHAVRAMATDGGHEVRQATEAEMLLNPEMMAEAIDRAPRLVALKAAVMATITDDEAKALIAAARHSAGKRYSAGTMANDDHLDETIMRFCQRIGEEAFRMGYDQLDARDAVNYVPNRLERARALRGLNVTRKGTTAGKNRSIDQNRPGQVFDAESLTATPLTGDRALSDDRDGSGVWQLQDGSGRAFTATEIVEMAQRIFADENATGEALEAAENILIAYGILEGPSGE